MRDYLDSNCNFPDWARPPRDDSKWVDPRCQRTKDEAPYAYSEFFLYGDREEIAQEGIDAYYSDRIWQYDREKAERLWKLHCAGYRWNTAGTRRIQLFCRDYFEKPKLTLAAFAEGCNASSGYPYWIVWFFPEGTAEASVQAQEERARLRKEEREREGVQL